METDLDYIGATRQDRIIAEQVRRQHQQRLEWVLRWLDRFGWSFDELPAYLAREIPFLANRGGEALRALLGGEGRRRSFNEMLLSMTQVGDDADFENLRGDGRPTSVEP